MNLDTISERILGKAAQNTAFANMLRSDGAGVGGPRGPWDPQKDLRLIIGRCCKGDRVDKEQLLEMLGRYGATMEQAYAGTMGVLTAELDGKPNNAVTLSGGNPALGATYMGGTPVPLYTRIGGVPAATPGVLLQTWLTIQRIVADPIDAQAGWKLVGGSVICTNDPVPTFPNDVAWSVLRPEISRLDSPLAQLYGRPVLVTSTLTMSAIHYGSVAIPMVQGITIEFQDMKCPDWATGTFGVNPRRQPFVQLTNRLIELVRGGADGGQVMAAVSNWRS